MKTINKIAILAALLLFTFTSEAQFTSSGSSKNKKGKGQSQNSTESSRQQDILKLEQKAKVAENDFQSGNTTVFSQHKEDVLVIMNREIGRSGQDLSALNRKLAYVPGGSNSEEGRALRVKIMQMEDRYNKQKRIRSNVSGMTLEKMKNPREVSGLKSQYSQFINSMKKNLKLSSDPTTPPPVDDKGKTGSGSTTTGKTSNEMYNTSSGSKVVSSQQPPESYFRYKDKKEKEYYLRMQKNTATALTNTAKEIETALAENKSTQASKLIDEVEERMRTDIKADQTISERLEKGELKFSGLNGGLILNKTAKKMNLIKKLPKIKLPEHKGQLYSMINSYNELLK